MLDPYQEIEASLVAIEELYPEALKEKETELLEEITHTAVEIDQKMATLELQALLSASEDTKNAFLSINAGAGGTESCDWALMLSRMYQRYCQQKGWKTELIQEVAGDVAGIKSITLKVTGRYAYGLLKAERGVHRLVRISPFDSNAKRHTSFASVDAVPEVDDVEVELRDEDLKVDTFRASGAGGQHVNTTDSAVRMTHIPTGIIVACQKERSQIKNRETCLKMIRAELYQKELSNRQKNLDELSGEKREIAFGSQIRNYVFHPYRLVKDTRTGLEKGNVEAVMDGDIEPFIQAYLLKKD